MRKIIVTLIAIMVVSSASALVDQNRSSNSSKDIKITSASSSAPGTSAAGPNEGSYSVNIVPSRTLSELTENRIENISRTERKISFTGYIRSPTPCHNLDHEVSREGSKINLSVSTRQSNETCVQQTVMYKYSAEVEAEEGFNLDVFQNGERSLNTETKAYREQTNGLVSEIVDWLRSLF